MVCRWWQQLSAAFRRRSATELITYIQAEDRAALASALIRVLSDVEFRRELGANARVRVQENFSTDLIVPRLQALWLDVMQERSGPHDALM